ncbi:MAG: histidinol dehydrogenase [Gluconacetobacter diazotrophicus]|nr:histidinol dehydrogenase [Gluconacetobacter diazotrophicus]
MIRLRSTDPDFAARFAALADGRRDDPQSVAEPVRAILRDVRERGDDAVCELTNRFDSPREPTTPDTLRLSRAEIDAAADAADPNFVAALELAAVRIEAFHRSQLPADLRHTDAAGVTLGMRWTPLDAVGLYVPGGKAAYPSSVLMNAIPARVAGVGRLAMCVPCPGGVLQPEVMAAARLAGVDEVFRIGGAQAVGALAYGTGAVAAVDRIVGPGNAFVAEAKRQVFGHVGIDSIAGPSEVLVVADRHNDPAHVAIDLLAQCEHDEAAQAILITDDPAFADAVEQGVEQALSVLPRAAIARASWTAHGAVVVVGGFAEAWPLVNRLAPEHLQLMLNDDADAFASIRHAGAIFRGRHCPEAIGDYVAGPNHVLPTARTARFASGLSVYDFLKRTTWVAADADALARIGPAAVTLAEAEGLQAHARSVAVRLQTART